MPMRLTGTLWKLRAKLTELTLPAAMPDATEVKNRNVMASMGWAIARGIDNRTYSRNATVRTAHTGRYRKSGATRPHDPHAEMEQRPDERADGHALDADTRPQHHGTQHDAQVVQQGSDAVRQETLACHEQLTQRERDREHERGQAHLAEQAGVLGRLLGIEAGRHQRHGPGRDEEQHPDRDGHDHERGRQDGARERDAIRGMRPARCA